MGRTVFPSAGGDYGGHDAVCADSHRPGSGDVYKRQGLLYGACIYLRFDFSGKGNEECGWEEEIGRAHV